MKLSLEKLQSLFPDGKMDRRGKNWITACPECGEKEFSISIDDNHLCGCYRKKQCGWRGNIYSLAIKIGRPDIIVNKEINFERIEKIKLFIEETELQLDLPDFNPPMGWKRIYENEYLDGRGFDQYQRYKVGATSIDPRLHNFVVFLIEEEDRIKGWIGRSNRSKKDVEKINAYYKANNIDKKALRYINSISDFGKLVFGLNELTENTKTLIIVEGIFDKFRIDKLLKLHEQEEVKCICTFKCAVSKEQIFKIQDKAPNIETIILIYDPDVIDDIKKAAFDLQQYYPIVLVGFSESGRDPGDFIEDDIIHIFENLKSPTAFALTKISCKKLKI